MLEPSNVRFVPVLKHDTEFHASSVCCFDEFVSSTGGDVNGLLREHMQTVTRSRYPVCCMQARRTSYRHEIHWAMTQERVEVLISLRFMFAAKAIHFLRVGSINGCNGNARNGACRPGMRVADVATTDKSYVDRHAIRALREFAFAAIVLSCRACEYITR